MTYAIEARGVSKLYGQGEAAVGLRDLTLEVSAGKIVALLGHNGAGKTTAVRGLATLLAFDSGTARVAGFDVNSQAGQVRERIALVGQAPAVDEPLTATQNLILFGRLRGLDRASARSRAGELLDQFGLTGAENRPVQSFSGGMRRRLDVAASMIVQPSVLFVDEPTAGLDPAARRDLWAALQALVANGTAILLTTQYLEEADALADHIVLLAHGRTIAEGTSDQLKDRLGTSVITLTFDSPELTRKAIPVLSAISPHVSVDNGTVASLPATDKGTLLDCVHALATQQISPVEAALRKPSLDDVFLSLTDTHSAPEGSK